MPTFKKIVVSGSAISQLNNDAGYIASAGGGIVSSSTQIIAGLTTTGIVSSSAQIDALFNIDGLISSSAQIATDISGAFTAVSGGLAGRITTNATNIGTNTSNITTNTTNIGLLTAETSSYALAANISGAFTAVSGGLAGRITTNATNIGTNTSNITTNTTNIGLLTGQTSSYALKTAISGAFTSTSSSIAGRVTTIEGTGTIQGVGTTNNVTFANVTATGNVSITGTLFVDGTTTTINSTNLNIEDKFILLNSGSTGGSPTEGGIIVESGSTGTGNAFYYDATDNRWSLKRGASSTGGGFDPEAFMSTVILDTTASVQSAGTYFKPGNIVINATGIFIIDNENIS